MRNIESAPLEGEKQDSVEILVALQETLSEKRGALLNSKTVEEKHAIEAEIESLEIQIMQLRQSPDRKAA